MSNIFSSSVGKKLLMSLMGLFLVVFLAVHLGINLLLIFSDTYEPFNKAAHFMGTNPLIKVMEIGLFLGILLHIVYGAILSFQNKVARPVGYKVGNNSQTSFFSKYMIHTAAVIFIFLILHIIDFYVKAKFLHAAKEVTYANGITYHDLGSLVVERFQIAWVVIVYVVSLLALGFHLHHGFQSAFQTIGLNHPVYTPVIKGIGVLYTFAVTAGFIAIPLVIYFTK